MERRRILFFTRRWVLRRFVSAVAELERRGHEVVVVFARGHERSLPGELRLPGISRTARALGIPSGFLVYSLDNLSNKGRVHVAPDRTFAWNEVQRREAVELHGLDPGSVVVTGAARWDDFLDLEPSVDRDEFCRRHGF